MDYDLLLCQTRAIRWLNKTIIFSINFHTERYECEKHCAHILNSVMFVYRWYEKTNYKKNEIPYTRTHRLTAFSVLNIKFRSTEKRPNALQPASQLSFCKMVQGLQSHPNTVHSILCGILRLYIYCICSLLYVHDDDGTGELKDRVSNEHVYREKGKYFDKVNISEEDTEDTEKTHRTARQTSCTIVIVFVVRWIFQLDSWIKYMVLPLSFTRDRVHSLRLHSIMNSMLLQFSHIGRPHKNGKENRAMEREML